MRRRAARLAVALACAIACAATAGEAAAAGWIAGVDVSGLEQVEAAGARFSDGEAAGDALAILRQRGLDAVRIRVWHSPPDGACAPAAAIRLARRATALGFEVMLDLHYSDDWADPAHQAKPRAWEAARGSALEDSVRRWTRDVVRDFRAAGIVPRWIQLGNEITHGMLWPDARIAGPEDDAGWRRLAALLRSAALGVREGAAGDRTPRLLLHFDDGGTPDAARRFFEHLDAHRVPYDDIALSYYPWWHGPLDSLEATLRALAPLGRDLYVVETAYPWTLGWSDTTHNIVGQPGQLLPGYPATPQGQRAFVSALAGRLARSSRGRGLFYWAPEQVTAPRRGSSWENLALFGLDGRPLPASERLGAGGAGR